MSAMFEFSAVSVIRGATRVLDDVTAAVPEYGITALIGPSGAGKSTMLRCCNRLERPSSGRVTYRGDDVAALDPLALRRRVAMVFQAPTVFPGSSFENLRAAVSGIDRERGAALLRRVGLPVEMLDREADTLSGGEAQRLCLARALATDPQVVLADEPTSSLDSASSRVLESLARSLAESGVPVVWVTHDMAQMRRLADHVIALDHGRLTYAGPAAEHSGRG
jgi:putative ABC transport system ATP-binding protein